jgi:signal transduction histidine kinase
VTVSYRDAGTTTGAARRGVPERWLLVVRVGWIGTVIAVFALLVVATPVRYSRLTHVSGRLETAVAHLGMSVSVYAALCLAADTLYVLSAVLIAWLIFSRTSTDPMALFVSLFLVCFAGATSSTIAALAMHHHTVDAFTTVLGALGYIGLNGLFYLFPDGRLVPRWTWIMLVIAVVGQVPFSMPATSLYNPNSWPAPLTMAVLLGIFGPAIFAQMYRYRRVSDSRQRQQTKWVVYGAITAIVLMFVARSGDANGPQLGQLAPILPVMRDPLLDLGFCLIPLSLGVSLLRHRLWDIDIIINRTLVYGGLTVLLIGLYVLIVGYLGTVLRTGNTLGVSLIGTAAVALLFQYLREYLQRGVNRLMYGDRDEPYAALSSLGKRLEATLVPTDALLTIVETVAHALKLPYVAIALRQGDAPVVRATHGSPVDHVLSLPLRYGTDTVGDLILGTRGGETSFSGADRHLLEDLARQAGVAAYAARLTADLQRSRERLVAAREEERRRLRRDLHDGLGPALGAFSLKLGAVRNVLPADQATADDLLAELIADVEEAVRDIRRLVYNLRPPSLDEFGLVGAIRSYAARYDTRGGQLGLQVRVDAPHDLSFLPAAAEVAAYRIVQEALANVARHAHAHMCCIKLTRTPNRLHVEIVDDGVGLPATWHAGVGLVSMRERAEELGGACTIESVPPGGTRVLAELPCAGPGVP